MMKWYFCTLCIVVRPKRGDQAWSHPDSGQMACYRSYDRRVMAVRERH